MRVQDIRRQTLLATPTAQRLDLELRLIMVSPLNGSW